MATVVHSKSIVVGGWRKVSCQSIQVQQPEQVAKQLVLFIIFLHLL